MTIEPAAEPRARDARFIERVRPTEERILEALATYRFLTSAQLMRLGVTSDRTHLYDTLRTLKRRKPALVRELAYGPAPGIGRPPSLYLLDPNAGPVLADIDPSWHGLAIPRTVRAITTDYRHRVLCVDFHIALRAWASSTGGRVDLYAAYYDPVPAGGRGRQPHHRTRVAFPGGVVVPDAILALVDKRGARRLFAFELYAGRRTDRVIEQLETYLRAFAGKALETAYPNEYGIPVLVAFEDREGMDLVRERARDHSGLSGAGASFFLAAVPDFADGFPHAWRRFDGTAARPF